MFARNALGESNKTVIQIILMKRKEGGMFTIFAVISSAGVVLMVLVTAVICICTRNRCSGHEVSGHRPRTIPTDGPSIYDEIPSDHIPENFVPIITIEPNDELRMLTIPRKLVQRELETKSDVYVSRSEVYQACQVNDDYLELWVKRQSVSDACGSGSDVCEINTYYVHQNIQQLDILPQQIQNQLMTIQTTSKCFANYSPSCKCIASEEVPVPIEVAGATLTGFATVTIAPAADFKSACIVFPAEMIITGTCCSKMVVLATLAVKNVISRETAALVGTAASMGLNGVGVGWGAVCGSAAVGGCISEGAAVGSAIAAAVGSTGSVVATTALGGGAFKAWTGGAGLILIGASNNPDEFGITYDCWKPVIHEEYKEPSRGILLKELCVHPNVLQVAATTGHHPGLPNIVIENIWNELFEIEYLWLHATESIVGHAKQLDIV